MPIADILPYSQASITLSTLHISHNFNKKSKGQTPEKGFAQLKDDITNNLGPQKPVIYSRYM